MEKNQGNKTNPFNNITERTQTPTYKDTFLHNVSNHPMEYNLAEYTGDGQK